MYIGASLRNVNPGGAGIAREIVIKAHGGGGARRKAAAKIVKASLLLLLLQPVTSALVFPYCPFLNLRETLLLLLLLLLLLCLFMGPKWLLSLRQRRPELILFFLFFFFDNNEVSPLVVSCSFCFTRSFFQSGRDLSFLLLARKREHFCCCSNCSGDTIISPDRLRGKYEVYLK